jgi:hypothetical protein
LGSDRNKSKNARTETNRLGHDDGRWTVFPVEKPFLLTKLPISLVRRRKAPKRYDTAPQRAGMIQTNLLGAPVAQRAVSHGRPTEATPWPRFNRVASPNLQHPIS